MSSSGNPLKPFEGLLSLAEHTLDAGAQLYLLPCDEVEAVCPLIIATLQAKPGEVILPQSLVGHVIASDVWCSMPVYDGARAVGTLIFTTKDNRDAPDAKQGILLEHISRTADSIAATSALSSRVNELEKILVMIEDMSGVCWWRVDQQTQTLHASAHMCELHGGEPGKTTLPFEKAMQAYDLPEQEAIRNANIHTMETGERMQLQCYMTASDGSRRIIMSQSASERDHQGNGKNIFGVFKDVTEQENLVAKLRRNEARYRLLAENVSDVITRVKMDGSSKYISPAIKSMLGWTLEEMSGQSTDYVYHEDRPKVLAAIQDAVRSGEPTRLEHRAVHRDGRVLWVECTFKALRDDQGGLDDVVVVIRDATQRKKLETEVIEAKERAEKAAEAKTEFLANMSHELRTPLTSVIGYSDLLKKSDGLTEAQRIYSERIGAASSALLMVINDILDYSKLEADAVELEKAPFDLRQHMYDTAGIIESQCLAKGLYLNIQFDERLPAILSGDAGRLRQVTLNFLSNAVKFTAVGGVSFKVFGTEMEDGRYRIRLEVHDTGIGLSHEKGNLIFGRFTQADASTTRVYGGSGLGLAISRRLIELMDGEIGYTSEPGKGSVFWFEVPLDFDFALPVDVAVDTTPEIGAKGRILMVDDAEANRELVSIILGTLGLEYEVASNGVEAVSAVRQRDFDLVLMDVHMPEMDGLAATREIRLMEKDRHLPILALTANVGADQIRKCMEAGMDGHLSKPIQVVELATTLREWLAK